MSDTRTHPGPAHPGIITRPPTERQARILAFVRRRIEHGHGMPEDCEIKARFSLDTSTTRRLVDGLVKRGLIDRVRA